MNKYTYADVIIDPNDPRVEIGADYYRADYPKRVLYLANNEGDYFGTLEEIDTESPETPFVVRTGSAHSPWACIIRKKEPEKKYMPFDLSLPEDREKLRGVWLRLREDGGEVMVNAIYASFGIIYIGNREVTPEFLLENYEFIDGSPCGKLVEVDE